MEGECERDTNASRQQDFHDLNVRSDVSRNKRADDGYLGSYTCNGCLLDTISGPSYPSLMSLLSWLGVVTDTKPLEVGADAPDAVVRDVHGAEVHLASFYQQGYTLVYFFPRADTPGCTKQACSLRDGFELLKGKQVEVVGISSDRPETQRHFQKKYRLPFMLLSDSECVAAKAFGVPTLLGMFHRQSFLIKNLKIVWSDLHASTAEQAADVLKVLERV
jgi:peroxiredoxin Q/BCP